MRILIVEDEFHLADAIKDQLKQNNIYSDICDNGRDGMNYALGMIYDIIILDIMLPQMDGFEVVKELRARHIKTPIILLTAKSDIDDKVKGLNLGADDYLTKPFEMRELMARIQAVLRREPQVHDSMKIKYADLSFDVGLLQITCTSSQYSIVLTAKEAQLFEFLLKNPNQILSKDMIIVKVWGYDNEAEYNNVEVYISFLRRKLKHIGTGVTIKTIRGLGYSLV